MGGDSLMGLVIFLGFAFAWIMGSSDAANTFGAALSDSTKGTRRTVVLVLLCILVGLVVLGSPVSQGIERRLASTNAPPERMGAAVLICLLVASSWSLFGRARGVSVSATHALMSAVVGALVALSPDPRIHGPWLILLAGGWILCPFAGLALAFVCTRVLQYFVGAEGPPLEVERARRAPLLLFAACLLAVAHGSNAAASTVAPLKAALDALASGAQTASESGKEISLWLLVVAGIGTGLVGVGVQAARVVRGAMHELAPIYAAVVLLCTGVIVLVASSYAAPVSTTHTLVAAILGVALARSVGALNLHTLRAMGTSWLVTIPVCAGVTYALLAVGARL